MVDRSGFQTSFHPPYVKNRTFLRCQCCQQGVSLPDSHGPSDLLGDDHPAQVVDAADDSGCFHIQNLLAVVFVGTGGSICGENGCYTLEARKGCRLDNIWKMTMRKNDKILKYQLFLRLSK